MNQCSMMILAWFVRQGFGGRKVDPRGEAEGRRPSEKKKGNHPVVAYNQTQGLVTLQVYFNYMAPKLIR